MVAESLLRDGDLSLERDYAEGRYAASEVEERLESLEDRVSKLEKTT